MLQSRCLTRGWVRTARYLTSAVLDVPCRGGSQDAVKWVPAYRAYLGEDWVNDASFERVCKAITAAGGAAPEVDFLVPPDRFAGLLDRFRHLESMTSDDAEDVGEDEVRLDEDEESALDTNDQDRWLEFFQWIGVNQVLRPVHFHDVEDRASGWLTTRNLRRPEGWAFTNIPEEKWNSFLQEISSKVAKEIAENPGAVPYFYRLHDLEHVVSLLDAAARDVSTGIGRAMYEHWARNWLLLETFAQLDVALVTGEPRRRAKPPRAYEEEILQLEESNFWVFRLRHAAVCPTGHGPRKPAEVWFPTQEVLRRFGRKTRDGQACLLPTIDLPAALLKGRARGIMQVMGIREELSPASFMEEDASVVLRRLEEVFGARVAHGDDLRQELREVIRPAYRHVLELLSGKTSSSGSTLKNAPLLAHDGEGHYAFRQANDVFYVERRDTRDRLRADVPIWTFVLEAYPAGRTPLVELLSCRVLEQAIKWRPRIGDPSLHSIDEATWRAHLRELAPYILARVGADRVEEGQARRDAAMLRQLILGLEPVMDIQLGCELDGHELPTKLIEREAFVDQDEAIGKMIVAYVRWGEGVWPPDEDDAEALATAFGEVLGAGYFESFLALIRAPSDARRESLLKRAGAPTDIEERRALLFENDPATGGVGLAPTEQQSEEPKTASAPSDGEEAAKQPPSSPPGTDRPVQVPLFTPDQLAIDGAPVTLIGTYTGAQEKHQRPEKNTTANPNDHNNDASNRTGYGGHTDLDALNSLGMAVTMAYELARLKKVGHGDVRAFDASSSDPQPDAVVFDVSTPARIATARTACPSFAQAFRRLSSTYGVSAEWPGFDVLTLVPGRHGEIDRMIELKASGVSARIQEMSWNEWKSARNNELRQCFYLYLVGNLRSDLQGNNPFVRTIRDPFGQLLAETQVSQRIERRVQLATHLFREAEHLDLTVRGEARSEL